MENPAVALLFDETADLLELDGANPFRVRAYRNAARVIRDLGSPVAELADRGEAALVELPGVGKDLARSIVSILTTGDFPAHSEMAAKFPEGLLEILRLPSLGPKRVKLLYDRLGVDSLERLADAIEAGSLGSVAGFGPKSAEKLKEVLAQATPGEHRMLLAEAEQYAHAVLTHLRDTSGITALEAAGSLRRRRETVGDLDILAATDDPEAAVERFVGFSEVVEVLVHGETKASVRLRGGPQVDLRVVKPDEFGAALHYFTGSKAHNVEMRKLAQAKKLKLNEYGLFRGDRRIAGRTEEEVFHELGLAWIPPELREARGEVERAQRRTLPDLISLEDIRGELHAHTDATDGRDSLADMVEGAKALGYAYLAITDHSKRVTMARGLDARRLRAQWRAIDRLNTESRRFTVLKGIELDILDEGRLDLPDDVLREADYVVASLHYGASRDAAVNTKRLVAAARHPWVDAIGHPTGRLLNRRTPYAIDFDEFVDACVGEGCLIELNGSPKRMDFPDHLAMAAADRGARFVCGTDSHAVKHLGYMGYAVAVARRAGLERVQVANSRPLSAFRKTLKRSAR
jgi:DNA polymerase (family 10)